MAIKAAAFVAGLAMPSFLFNWENNGKQIFEISQMPGYIRSRVPFYKLKSNFGNVRLCLAVLYLTWQEASAFPEQNSPEKVTTFLGLLRTGTLGNIASLAHTIRGSGY